MSTTHNTRGGGKRKQDKANDNNTSKTAKQTSKTTNEEEQTDEVHEVTPEKPKQDNNNVYVVFISGVKPKVLTTKADLEEMKQTYGPIITNTRSFPTEEAANTFIETNKSLEPNTTKKPAAPSKKDGPADEKRKSYLQKVANHTNNTSWLANVFLDKYAERAVIQINLVQNPDADIFWCHKAEVFAPARPSRNTLMNST